MLMQVLHVRESMSCGVSDVRYEWGKEEMLAVP